MKVGWFLITVVIAFIIAALNYLQIINNLAYILITTGFLMLGFLFGIFLQGSDAQKMTGFGLKLLAIGIIMLVLFFLW